MSDYGKGSILGTATTLPATSALGLVYADQLPSILLISFIVISSLSFIITFGLINRYLANLKA